MRILNQPEPEKIPDTPAAPAPAAKPTAPIELPDLHFLDVERVEALENVANSILERVQTLEERLNTIEKVPKKAVPEPILEVHPVKTPAVPVMQITFDTEAMKKGLFDKMWKHLNHDDRSDKAV